MKFLGAGSMKNADMGATTSKDKARLILRLFVRLLQFVLGIVVIGLYAQDLLKASKAGKYMDSKWVYAVSVGSIASFSAVALVVIRGWFFFIIDVLVWFLYLVLFGIFGKMYIGEDPEGNKGIIRMKNAVWIILVNMLLWIGTAIYGGVVFWKAKKAGNTTPSFTPSVV